MKRKEKKENKRTHKSKNNIQCESRTCKLRSSGRSLTITAINSSHT